MTKNPDFPVTDSCHDNRFGDDDAFSEGFITKFSSDLGTILASTFIGGDYYDGINAMAVDVNDQIYVAGFSRQSEVEGQTFPVTDGAFDESPTVIYWNKGVVAKLDSNLNTVLAATYLGGNNCDKTRCEDEIHCLAIDGKGDIWVAGHTTYPVFPVTDDSLDTSYHGEEDMFVSSFDPDLTKLKVSTYIGGINRDEPTDMLFDNQGNLYLLGWTYSTDFPMPDDGYLPKHGNHEEDGFILKLSPSADEILAGTFLGAEYDGTIWGDDAPAAMVLSADGNRLHVVGRTESENFPTTADCHSNLLNNGNINIDAMEGPWTPPRDWDDHNAGDGFLVTFSADLTSLIYATFLGGEYLEYLDDVMLNGDVILIAGQTNSNDFPGLEIDSDPSLRRGVLIRFSDTATTQTDPIDPTDPGNADNSGDGGGGGGCFVSTIADRD
jgi:hypothetical protein